MITWLAIFGIVWLGLLVLMSYVSSRKNETTADYLMAGSNVGTFLGVFTFAATLFSTFTLLGMPDFFRSHGVGAWIFLAVADAAMVFLILWFGYQLRKRVAQKGFRGMSGLMQNLYGGKWAGYVFFAGVFLFLIPYVAIQIRGVSVFLEAAFVGSLPAWGWATAMVVVMLLYSEVGGLKAIIFSDSVQGLVLLTVVWIIALSFVGSFGGVGGMFEQVAAVEPALLGTPGPNGLFTFQFMVASFFAILMIPVTQPQVTIRLVIMKSRRSLYRMAVAVGVFAIAIILPTLVIGMYGAVHYAGAPPADFWAGTLLGEQPGAIAALVLIGLIAAAVSTADSQIFALGTEVHSLLPEKGRGTLLRTKVSIVVFALSALIFSILSSDQLVALALKSFAGTSLLAPMVLSGIFAENRPGPVIPAATGVGLLLFLGAQFGLVPGRLGGWPLELLLLAALAVVAVGTLVVRNRSAEPVSQGV